MDGRVLDAPWPIRFCVVNFTILPTRPRESAHAYSTIWTAEGSPLIVTSRHVRQLLQDRLSVPVELAMRYQNPSIESAVKSLAARGVAETFLIPLFPHYAMSSYESAVVRVQDVARRIAPGMTVEVMPPCYDHPDYIKALVASARDALAQPHDHVLFSFHGLPERHMRKADPTGSHCLASPNCCEMPSVGAQDVLPGPVLQDRARLRGEREDPGRQVLRLVSIPPRTGALDAAVHRRGARAARPLAASRGCWCSARPSSPIASRRSRRLGCAGGIRS